MLHGPIPMLLDKSNDHVPNVELRCAISVPWQCKLQNFTDAPNDALCDTYNKNPNDIKQILTNCIVLRP